MYMYMLAPFCPALHTIFSHEAHKSDFIVNGFTFLYFCVFLQEGSLLKYTEAAYCSHGPIKINDMMMALWLGL